MVCHRVTLVILVPVFRHIHVACARGCEDRCQWRATIVCRAGEHFVAKSGSSNTGCREVAANAVHRSVAVVLRPNSPATISPIVAVSVSYGATAIIRSTVPGVATERRVVQAHGGSK